MKSITQKAGAAGVSILLSTAAAFAAPFAGPSAQALASPSAAPQATSAAVTPALARALESVSPENMKADLFFLASDELMGRDSPSPELRIAARYVRARLQRLGLAPGARDGSYFHEYTLPQVGLLEEGTHAALTVDGDVVPLSWTKDYYLGPTAFGKRTVEGPLVWGGTLEADDLAGIDVRGKWVVGRPAGDRGPSNSRRSALEEAGAVGIVLLPFGPDVAKQMAELEAQNDRRRGMSLGSRRSSNFPVVHVKPAIAKRIERLIPPDAAPGQAIAAQLAESCDYGPREDAVLENVCAFWPGSDPELKDEVILISAHYDHVGTRADGDVFNGADDNASGSTGLLAIADALVAYGPMRRSVMLLWVSAEEKGLLGSRAWTRDPTLPEGTTALCNLNIDMIGRNAPDEILITPTRKHPAYSLLTQCAERHAPEEGFNRLRSADDYWNRSDHANFAENMKIPVAFLFSDVHADYHQVSDTADKIDYDKASRVVRLVLRMLEDLQVDDPQF